MQICDCRDGNQKEDISLEGLEWLSSRTGSRNPSDRDSLKRVIVIHSPLQPIISKITKNKETRDKEDLKNKKDTSDPLLTKEIKDSDGLHQEMLQPQGSHSVTDLATDEKLQLLLDCIRATSNDCARAKHQGIHGHVFTLGYEKAILHICFRIFKVKAQFACVFQIHKYRNRLDRYGQ